MKRLFIVLLMFSAICLLASCSKDKGRPTDAQIAPDVKAFMYGRGIWEVVNVEKAAGMVADGDGYKIEVQATLKFNYNLLKDGDTELNDMYKSKGYDEAARTTMMNTLKQRFGLFEKGKTYNYQLWFKYVKIGDSWKISAFADK
ncbi:MAG: hypothetical protein WCP33_04565 [Deltaproteobacteria bacterium]